MRSKVSLYLTAAVMIGAVLISACQAAPAPQDIMKNSLQSMQQLKSVTFEYTVAQTNDTAGQNLQTNGIYEAPDKVYTTSTYQGSSIEILVVSANDMYERATGDTGFSPLPAEALSTTGLSANPFAGQLKMMQSYKNVKQVGIEKIDSIDCYHVTFDLDMKQAMAASIFGDVPGAATVTGTANGEAWVGVKDGQQHKTLMRLVVNGSGGNGTIEFTSHYTKFNEPVTFPKP
jgi:hypothetical protein